MATFSEAARDLIMELLRERMTRVRADIRGNQGERSRQTVTILRAVQQLYHDEPAVFEAFLADFHIPARPTPQRTQADPAPVAAEVTDDEEEEEEVDEEEEGDEDEEGAEGPEQAAEAPGVGPEPGFDFEPGRVYRSSTARIGDRLVGVGYGYRGHDGRDHYTSERGIRHDMTQRAPQPCFNCGEFHWRINCPYARGNETI